MSVHQGIRWTYDELGERVQRLARGLLAAGLRGGRPGRPVEPELRRVDARPVRHRRDRRGAREHQPGVPLARAGLRARPVGLPHAHRGPDVQDVGLPGHGRRGPRRARRSSSPSCSCGTPEWDALLDESTRRLGGRARGPAGHARPRRRHQHPVHVGHHGLPEGRHPLAPEHPEQRLLRDRAAGLHARGPAVHPGALLPLLRDGDGQPRVHHARRHDGDPGRRVRARRRAPGGAGRAVHGALRRAHDVRGRAGPPGLRRRSTCPRCAPG